MSVTVLIIGNEKDIVDENLMKRYFHEKKITICLEDNQKSALEKFNLIEPNIVIIDNNINDNEAIHICKKIKKISTTPIYYLSSNNDPEKIISTFDAGIDDYIMKPFQRSILTAKIIANSIKKLHDELPKQNSENKKYLKIGNVEINLDGYIVKVGGEKINLIAKELKILLLFVRNPDKIFSAEKLYHLIWGTDSYGDARTVMVHISNLRKKIEYDPSNPQIIQTVRGFGYKFCIPS